MPTTDRPADLVSQGGQVTNSELCWNGPVWLCNPEMWPEKLVPVKSKTSEEEAKVIRELLSLPSEKPELNGTCLTNSLNAMIYAELFTSKLGCNISLLTGCTRDLLLAKTFKRPRTGG